MTRMKLKVLGSTVLLLSGCTSIDVRPVASDVPVQDVCIVHNDEVLVSDFVSVLRDGFERHRIATRVVSEAESRSCETTLTYTAARGWDLAPYLDEAELRLWRGGRQIGAADYRHRGGLALTKFAGTRTKLDPVIDQLLGGSGANR